MSRAVGVVLLLVLLGWALPASAQFRGREPTIKTGLNRVFVSGASYELETGGSNSDTLVGNELFLEYILFGRLGLEVDFTLTPLTRTFELTDSGDTVTETTTTLLYGANLYFGRNRTRGLNYYFGLATGTYNVKHEFAAGTGGTFAGQSSSQTVPVNLIKFGVDWIMEQAGLRFQYGLLSGTLTESEALGQEQTLDYTATVLTIGVFAFF